MRRSSIVLWFVVFFLPITQAQVQDKALAYPKNDFFQQKAHKILRVVDGDTFLVNYNGKEEKVRMIGVDTPETIHPNKPVEEYGKEASRFTKNLLSGEEVYLIFEDGSLSRDKYQRLLAYVYRAPDGLFVNLELIRQGYAHAYTQYPFQYMELFRLYERKAREAGKGLWSDSGSSKASTSTGSAGNQRTGASSVLGNPTGQVQNQEQTVYVTKSGKKYHRAGCRSLSKSQIPMTLEQAKKSYGPCSICRP